MGWNGKKLSLWDAYEARTKKIFDFNSVFSISVEDIYVENS